MTSKLAGPGHSCGGVVTSRSSISTNIFDYPPKELGAERPELWRALERKAIIWLGRPMAESSAMQTVA
jgi:hypothetical protein